MLFLGSIILCLGLFEISILCKFDILTKGINKFVGLGAKWRKIWDLA